MSVIERKLNVINLYKRFMKVPAVMEYFKRPRSSMDDCIDEGMSAYSYDIGYLL